MRGSINWCLEEGAQQEGTKGSESGVKQKATRGQLGLEEKKATGALRTKNGMGRFLPPGGVLRSETQSLRFYQEAN